MRSAAKGIRFALAASGILGGLALTAQPLIRVWQEQEAPLPTPQSAIVQSETLSNTTPTSIVVDLNDNVSEADIRDISAKYGINLQPNSIEAQDNKLMRALVPVGKLASGLFDRLKSDPRVEVAEPEQIYTTTQEPIIVQVDNQVRVSQDINRSIYTYEMQQSLAPQIADSKILITRSLTSPSEGGFPNDPRYAEQWSFQMVGAESAWKRARGKGVVVAVIDTGVSGVTTKKGKACRDFGQTKFVEGYDFVNNDKDPYDDHAHGTHVAGTIAESTNNNEGVAGLAFEATIMPLKVLSAQGSGTSSDIADAIRWAADHGANVINMSLGSAFPSDVIHKACKYAAKKGVVIVCAAGNGFGAPVGYPAAFPECIAVSSVGPTGNIAKYSSYGKEVALAAPGGDMIDSGDPADGILQNTNYPESAGGRGDDYYAFQGTSMASPHVAAVAALIMSQGVTDPARVKDILVKSAVPKGDKNKYGAGILSAANATAKAEGLTKGVKLRHLVAFGLLVPFFLMGRRTRFGLRLAMYGALLMGFYGADWFASVVGADSAWNLLSFSALAPLAAYALLRNGLGIKVAGVLGVGTAVGLWANWHNGTIPFTTATFGEAALPWTALNLVMALAIGMLAARRIALNNLK